MVRSTDLRPQRPQRLWYVSSWSVRPGAEDFTCVPFYFSQQHQVVGLLHHLLRQLRLRDQVICLDAPVPTSCLSSSTHRPLWKGPVGTRTPALLGLHAGGARWGHRCRGHTGQAGGYPERDHLKGTISRPLKQETQP